MSGSLAVDQPKAMYLAELALDLARQVLKKNGSFLTKTFQGEGYQEYHKDMKTSFQKVITRKPDSSRAVPVKSFCWPEISQVEEKKKKGCAGISSRLFGVM